MQFTFSTIAALTALASTAFASPISQRDTGMYMINVVNQCSQTIWPAAGQTLDSPGKICDDFAGFVLAPGASKVIAVPTNWVAGRLFARTGCLYEGDNFVCETGDCGGFTCGSSTGVSGVTLAEFSYSDMVKTFYNISLVSGFNLGMKITTTDSTCPAFECSSSQCSDTQAYLAGSSSNPCHGCPLSAGYTVTFCG